MTQETFNEKDSSQISGENENIKILTKRTFESGIGYRLKHIHSLMSMNNPDSLPKYWDDPSISIDESSNIEWMAGVEIHLYKNVIAFYGRNLTDHRKKYLGPILFMENSPEGQIKFKSDLCNLGFKITRFLMETTGIYHFSVAWFLQKNYPNSMVIVMNAKSLKDYMPKISKNDKADAIRIAQVAHLDELIKPSYIPTELEFALRETLRQRNKLIATCVRQKNVIKKMFSTIGFTYKFNFDTNWEIELLQSFLSSTGNFGSVIKAVKNNQMVKKNMKKLSEWSNFSISDTNRGNILLMFSILKQSQLQVEMLETALVREIKKDTALCNKVDLLENCSGIGYISAVSLVLESGNMNRFHSVSHYLSYCGISPTSGTSGYDNPKDEVEKVVKIQLPISFLITILKPFW
jgi:transposase